MSGIAMGVGAAVSLIGGIFGRSKAKKRARAAAREKAKLQAELNRLENNRQAIINPYEGTKSVADLAQDLSGGLSNPYANLGVATKAAEMQIAESDIALANTLDTLRSTGASAGGATALAQAALKSKQSVSASIEQQEAKNEQLKAQGETTLQTQRMAEQQRLQGIEISEEQRVQQAQAAGKQFMFSAKEQRETQKLNRVAGQIDNARADQRQAQADGASALSGMVGGLTSIASAGIGKL